jgi:hypothetical protein
MLTLSATRNGASWLRLNNVARQRWAATSNNVTLADINASPTTLALWGVLDNGESETMSARQTEQFCIFTPH